MDRFNCRIPGLVIFVLLVLALGACHDGPPWATKNITGLMPRLGFHLTEASQGAPVEARDFHGKVVLMFFGYTHCPDVCPLTLGRMKTAIAKLGDAAGQVRVLFVTVDPARDSLQVLKRYTAFFGPQVLGLRGDPAALRKLTKMYRVTYGYDKPDAKGNYNVSHSSAVYVFDREGEARLLIRPQDSVQAISADLKRLIGEQHP